MKEGLSTQRAIDRRYELLADLYVGDISYQSITHLCKKYKVSTNFIPQAVKLGYIKIVDNKFHFDEEPSLKMAETILNAERAIFKKHTPATIISETRTPIELIIRISEIVIRYNITGDALKNFVNDILKIVK